MTAKRGSGHAELNERIAASGADSIWIGDSVQLRAYEPEDADSSPLFFSSADDRSGSMVRTPRSRVATRKFFEEFAEKRPGGEVAGFDLVIARREDNVMVGGIGVHDVDQINGTFAYGLGVRPEHKGHGYGAEAVVLLLRFMFDERRFQKCEAHVYEYNSASIALHRKLGFVEEGRLRRHLFQAGGYYDEFRFGMTVEEFHELYPLLRSKV
jgi:RimJ/RimL family protein N-acetyltransferase